MTPANSWFPADSDTRRKSMLYCPECGHESPVGGDWHTEPDAARDRIAYHCPECGSVITTRPVGFVTA